MDGKREWIYSTILSLWQWRELHLSKVLWTPGDCETGCQVHWGWSPPPQWPCWKSNPYNNVNHLDYDAPCGSTLARCSRCSTLANDCGSCCLPPQHLMNHVPNLTSGLCQSDVFHDLHVWGCPVYVLEEAIADGDKLPCRKPWSICCINMGLSKKHKSTVQFVLNQETGYITPQYDVVLMTGLQRWQLMWMPSQILTQCVGPHFLVTLEFGSHSTRTTTMIQQRRCDSQTSENINRTNAT